MSYICKICRLHEYFMNRSVSTLFSPILYLIFFVKVFEFLLFLYQNFYFVSDMLWHLFFCNSLTTYSHSSKKYLQMIVVTFSANRIHQNCCQTNSLRTSFWYLIVVKIRANLSIVRFFLAFRYFSLHTDSL